MEREAHSGARLCRGSKLLNAQAAVTIVHNSKQRAVLEKFHFPGMLKHIVDGETSILSGRGGSHSHRPRTVLVLVRS